MHHCTRVTSYEGAKPIVSLIAYVQGETELPGKFDVIRIDLQPTEQYKSVSAQLTCHLPGVGLHSVHVKPQPILLVILCRNAVVHNVCGAWHTARHCVLYT